MRDCKKVYLRKGSILFLKENGERNDNGTKREKNFILVPA